MLSLEQSKYLKWGLCIAAVVVIVWVLMKTKKEGYHRSMLGQNSFCNLDRTPNDYMFDRSANPHWQAYPASKYQPLTEGPIDFYADQRKIYNDYPMYSQYGNYYSGCFSGCAAGGRGPFLTDDEKGRGDLLNVGSLGIEHELTDISHDYDVDPRQLHVMNLANQVYLGQPAPPYGYNEIVGS